MTNVRQQSISKMRLDAALLIVLGLGLTTTQSAQAQTFNVLYSFTGGADGQYPTLTAQDPKGNFYGFAQGGNAGCSSNGCGVVFKLTKSYVESVLYSFNGGTDGSSPIGLIRDGKGNFYGTTLTGGGSGCGGEGCGTVFELQTSGKETILYRFVGGTDGVYPYGGLTMDAAGNLYGTTYEGGGSGCDGGGCGTVFKLQPSGKEIVLYRFAGKADGAQPFAGVIMDAAGNLYGTTFGGGVLVGCGGDGGECGVVFKLDAAGKETVLHTFTGADGDGANPIAGLIQDAAGNFYGTTYYGGILDNSPGFGTVFMLSKKGKEKVLYRFDGLGYQGAYPSAGLVQDARGNLYGCNTNGGENELGVAFKVNTAGRLTVLHTFAEVDGAPPSTHALIRDAPGKLYGAGAYGGAFGAGTVWELTP